MKTILYIGNKLSSHGNTATSIETLGSFLENENFSVYYASSRKNKIFRMLDMVLTTLKYCRRIDYVLIDTYSTTNFWYAFVISQLCRVLHLKYIAKLHGGNLPFRLQKSTFFCDCIFRNSYMNIAPSGYLLESFNSFGYSNVRYIPNTLEINRYDFEERTFDVPKILWVRSFSAIYNPVMAVKVLVALKNKYPDAELCMVGPKKDKSYEQTVAFAKQNNVEVLFTGKLSKKKWTSLAKKYNVFINTTHFDNTPISVIEAMALGLPVVSTNVGGIPFLLEDEKNSLLVDDNDTTGMVTQIDRLVVEKGLAKKIVSNAYEMTRGFDWEIVKKQWIELLK
jgi:L-malate glycosyltransferase